MSGDSLPGPLPAAARPGGADDGDRYMPLKRLVDYSGLGLRTLRGYLAHATKPMPHYRVGGKIVVRRSQFDEWMKQFAITGTSRVNEIVDELLTGD